MHSGLNPGYAEPRAHAGGCCAVAPCIGQGPNARHALYAHRDIHASRRQTNISPYRRHCESNIVFYWHTFFFIGSTAQHFLACFDRLLDSKVKYRKFNTIPAIFLALSRQYPRAFVYSVPLRDPLLCCYLEGRISLRRNHTLENRKRSCAIAKVSFFGEK